MKVEDYRVKSDDGRYAVSVLMNAGGQYVLYRTDGDGTGELVRDWHAARDRAEAYVLLYERQLKEGAGTSGL